MYDSICIVHSDMYIFWTDDMIESDKSIIVKVSILDSRTITVWLNVV